MNSNGGDDAVSLNATYARFAYTGDGADAVVIEADRVEYVNTDLAKRSLANGSNVIASYANDDALAITAKSVQGVTTGGGNDTIVISAALVEWVNGGDGNDNMVVNGGMLNRIDGGRGDDTMTINATLGDGIRQVARWAPSSGTPDAEYRRPDTIEGRMQMAAKSYADVRGQFGDDTINVSVKEMIAVSGGEGNDTINVQSGTDALRVSEGSGDDIVTVVKGGELVIKFENMAASYTVDMKEDDMIIRHAAGSITIENYKQADAIGVARGARVEKSEDIGAAVTQVNPLTSDQKPALQIGTVDEAAFFAPDVQMLHIRDDLGVKTAV